MPIETRCSAMENLSARRRGELAPGGERFLGGRGCRRRRLCVGLPDRSDNVAWPRRVSVFGNLAFRPPGTRHERAEVDRRWGCPIHPITGSGLASVSVNVRSTRREKRAVGIVAAHGEARWSQRSRKQRSAHQVRPGIFVVDGECKCRYVARDHLRESIAIVVVQAAGPSIVSRSGRMPQDPNVPHFDIAPSELVRHRTERAEPPDLDAFWRLRVDEAEALKRPVELVPFEGGSYGLLRVWDVTFTGHGGTQSRRGCCIRRPTHPCRAAWSSSGMAADADCRSSTRSIPHAVMPPLSWTRAARAGRGPWARPATRATAARARSIPCTPIASRRSS